MPGGRASGAAAPPAGESKRPPSAELAKAQVEAQRTEARAQQAEQALLSLTERIDAQRKSVELERRLVETARAKAQNAEATEKTLTAQRQRRTADGAPAGELGEISANIDAARQRGREARDEIARRIEGLEKLQSELARLQGEQIAQLQQAERERRAAVSAREQVEALENPLSPRNLYQWVIARGPRVLGIVVGVIAFLWLSRRIENRIIPLVAGRTEQGTLEERENRARTLVEVFHYVATVVLVSGGALMVLTELGVNIVPLMGGAAVIGLAVAFGAQNLIRDYFYGFMILLENQYAINDVVKIGSTSGMVEKITLRITVLRDLEGVVHFIPNGQIAQVSNLTHGWSRALFDIGVSYEEDVDRVMAVLTDLGRELRRDPEYRRLILDDPEMLGVEKFENSCVVIRFIMKTRPMHQWKVRREMLRRIKNRFDKEGIEIPYPQRTVHHRYPDASKAGTPPEFADGAD
ncbi:MAG: mechanosensitive ion channel [Phycisphaerae bacterium]